MKTQQNKFWLQTQVNDILEPMMLATCHANPDNKIAFMLKYLEDMYGDRATRGDRAALANIQSEVLRLEGLVEAQREKTRDNTGDEREEERGSEDETDEDDEDDYVDVLPAVEARKNKGPRASVSAEAFGAFNRKEDFQARIVAKSDEAKEAIMDKIEKSFMFSGLDAKERIVVVDAMEERKCYKNEVVIKEGDEGDALYVVASGTLSCTKVFKGQNDPTFLKRYEPGEAFGELALLYNAPRAATIASDGDSVLYALDRATFNHIVKDAAIRKREKYETFLKSVDILKTMEDYERSQISEAFKDAKFEAGETIIKQGDEGRELYFLVEGEAYATIEEGGVEQEVKQYATGDYFGELALLTAAPRAANVKARTAATAVSMDRHAFKRMLGPLEEILKRNLDLYVKFKK